ncbi:transcriptional repressor LexA [Streptomyces sp. NPDC020800]|uniref:transcriptional repressor LexA n=1 Tax=Streptomyces sp. NPDC020800 TaxID=3365092 RepID=UPI00379264A9
MEADTITRRPGRPSGGQTSANGLTDRQEAILDFIGRSVRQRGYPPAMREIGAEVGLASTSSVAHQIRALVKKGHLRQDPQRPRAYVPAHPLAATNATRESAVAGDVEVAVPLVGRIAAGTPITAEQSVEDVLVLPRQVVGTGDLFALTVSGDSMIGTHIADGDTVVVRVQPDAQNGEIVAAMIEGEATVKRLRRHDGGVWLMPENEEHEPINGTHATILGRVVAVLRAL